MWVAVMFLSRLIMTTLDEVAPLIGQLLRSSGQLLLDAAWHWQRGQNIALMRCKWSSGTKNKRQCWRDVMGNHILNQNLQGSLLQKLATFTLQPYYGPKSIVRSTSIEASGMEWAITIGIINFKVSQLAQTKAHRLLPYSMIEHGRSTSIS